MAPATARFPECPFRRHDSVPSLRPSALLRARAFSALAPFLGHEGTNPREVHFHGVVVLRQYRTAILPGFCHTPSILPGPSVTQSSKQLVLGDLRSLLLAKQFVSQRLQTDGPRRSRGMLRNQKAKPTVDLRVRFIDTIDHRQIWIDRRATLALQVLFRRRVVFASLNPFRLRGPERRSRISTDLCSIKGRFRYDLEDLRDFDRSGLSEK